MFGRSAETSRDQTIVLEGYKILQCASQHSLNFDLGFVDSHVYPENSQSTRRDFISWSKGKQVKQSCCPYMAVKARPV